MKQLVITLVLIAAALCGGFLVARHTTIVGPPAWEYKVVSLYEVADIQSRWDLLKLPEDSAADQKLSNSPRNQRKRERDDPFGDSLQQLSDVSSSERADSASTDTSPRESVSKDSPLMSLEDLNRKIVTNSHERIAAGLNKLGADGWELVAIDDDAYYFKRRR